MLCCCLEQLTASILTHTGPSGAPTTGDVRESREREIEEANGVITSIHPRWQQHREREGRAKPPPATPPSTNLKTIFDVAAAAAAGERNSQREAKLELPQSAAVNFVSTSVIICTPSYLDI